MTMRLKDRILDRSVFFSFDRSGYQRHQRAFVPTDLNVSMKGKVCLVSGANSGIGLEIARGLAALDASVYLLCRSWRRGAIARDSIISSTGNPHVHLSVVDISSPEELRTLVAQLDRPAVDVLVHNAGVLSTAQEFTAEGFEATVATHLVGPHLLMQLLAPRMTDARVIFVSSGGMYARRLDLGALLSRTETYDGIVLTGEDAWLHNGWIGPMNYRGQRPAANGYFGSHQPLTHF